MCVESSVDTVTEGGHRDDVGEDDLEMTSSCSRERGGNGRGCGRSESKTPVIKSSAVESVSDSVFSFESAYRQHKLSLS